MSHFLAYILQFQEIIVNKIPPVGEGVYSQPKVYRSLCAHDSIYPYLSLTRLLKYVVLA